MKQLHVLSMWQPWATLCVAPLEHTGEPPKRHETRAFAPKRVPIDVAIHATQKWDRYNAWTAGDGLFRGTLRALGFMAGPHSRRGVLGDPNLKELPFGKIIGIATIAEVHPAHHVGEQPLSELDSKFGDFSYGRFAWRFENTQLLPEPIPFKGRQDVLWPLLQRDILDRINEQLSGVAA